MKTTKFLISLLFVFLLLVQFSYAEEISNMEELQIKNSVGYMIDYLAEKNIKNY